MNVSQLFTEVSRDTSSLLADAVAVIRSSDAVIADKQLAIDDLTTILADTYAVLKVNGMPATTELVRRALLRHAPDKLYTAQLHAQNQICDLQSVANFNGAQSQNGGGQ